MDCRFNKSLLVILALSSLLLSTNAVPSTRIIDVVTSIPDVVHKSISTSFPSAVAPSSHDIGFPSSFPSAVAPSSHDIGFPSTNVPAAAPSDAALLGNPDYPEVSKLCIDGENVALCAETILKQMTGPFDPLNALEIAVDATFEQAKVIAGTVVDLLHDPSTDENAMDALSVCEEVYDDMLDAIEDTVDLLEKQNIVDAYYKFNSVVALKSSCEDAFVESPGVTMPFTQDSRTLYQLTGNCLGIMHDLVTNFKL